MRSAAEVLLWHDLDKPISYALDSGVSYDRIIATMTDKIALVAKARDVGIDPQKYLRFAK